MWLVKCAADLIYDYFSVYNKKFIFKYLISQLYTQVNVEYETLQNVIIRCFQLQEQHNISSKRRFFLTLYIGIDRIILQ